MNPDSLEPLFAPLTSLRGIGPAVAALIARAAGGTAITPRAAEPRRQRRDAVPAPVSVPAPRPAFDPEAAWDKIRRAAEHLAAAEAAAEASIARVERAVRERFS